MAVRGSQMGWKRKRVYLSGGLKPNLSHCKPRTLVDVQVVRVEERGFEIRHGWYVSGFAMEGRNGQNPPPACHIGPPRFQFWIDLLPGTLRNIRSWALSGCCSSFVGANLGALV
jgi:hypothetical protein